MKQFFKLSGAFFSFFFLASGVLASSQYGARIISLSSYQSQTGSGNAGFIYFTLEGSRTSGSIPTCASGNTYWVVNNVDPDTAKEQISMLIAASSQGRPVNIIGTNDCTRNGTGNHGGEIVQYLWVN